MDDVRATYIRDLAFTFRYHKSVADRALAQVADEDLHTLVDGEANSIAIIIKHVAGNLRSRYHRLPDQRRREARSQPRRRVRDAGARLARPSSSRRGTDAFGLVLDTIDALQPDDLARTVHVRKEPFTVVEALNRSVTHTAYHVGQIVLLAKHFCGAGWKTLTIPKGKSAEHEIPYKARLQMRPGG